MAGFGVSGWAELLGSSAVIFVTVGSMLPFDRLINAADEWAQTVDQEVFAQIGNSECVPRHMRFAKMLAPGEFTQKMRSASLIIAHAGMGSIISAMEAGKPIVVVPRRVADHEVTTDHQIHTASWLKTKEGVFVAPTESELSATVALALASIGAANLPLRDSAPQEFTARIRSFIDA